MTQVMVDTAFFSSERTLDLRDALHEPLAEAYLLRLWAHAMEQGNRAGVVSMTPTRLAKRVDYTGAPDVLMGAFVQSGFLVPLQGQKDTYFLRGWGRNEAYFSEKERRASYMRDYRKGRTLAARNGDLRESPPKIPTLAASLGDSAQSSHEISTLAARNAPKTQITYPTPHGALTVEAEMVEKRTLAARFGDLTSVTGYVPRSIYRQEGAAPLAPAAAAPPQSASAAAAEAALAISPADAWAAAEAFESSLDDASQKAVAPKALSGPSAPDAPVIQTPDSPPEASCASAAAASDVQAEDLPADEAAPPPASPPAPRPARPSAAEDFAARAERMTALAVSRGDVVKDPEVPPPSPTPGPAAAPQGPVNPMHLPPSNLDQVALWEDARRWCLKPQVNLQVNPPKHREAFAKMRPTWRELVGANQLIRDAMKNGTRVSRGNMTYALCMVDRLRHDQAQAKRLVIQEATMPRGYEQELDSLGLQTVGDYIPKTMAHEIWKREVSLERVRYVAEQSATWSEVGFRLGLQGPPTVGAPARAPAPKRKSHSENVGAILARVWTEQQQQPEVAV